MKTASEMTKNVLERKNAYEKKRKKIKVTALTAFALAVVYLAVFAALGKSGILTKPVPQPQTTTADSIINQPMQSDKVQNVLYSGYKEVISGDNGGNAYSYQSPDNGTVGMSYPLSEAIKKYGDSVRYRIEIDFFKDKTELDKDSDEVKAEIERISNVLMKKYSIGLSVITFTDSSGNKIISVSHDGAEKELIENFPVSDDYGYMLWLYTEGEKDDTGATAEYNGGFIAADSVTVVRHNDKNFFLSKTYRFLKNQKSVENEPSDYGEIRRLSEFEDFQKEKIGDFIGMAKNDVVDYVALGAKNTFDEELSSNVAGEVYTAKDTEGLYIILHTDEGILAELLE